jgi:hypothetical protein
MDIPTFPIRLYDMLHNETQHGELLDGFILVRLPSLAHLDCIFASRPASNKTLFPSCLTAELSKCTTRTGSAVRSSQCESLFLF